ncbi:MAG: alpha/beta fold hydrolase [Pyrinomonadaceae bacterium]
MYRKAFYRILFLTIVFSFTVELYGNECFTDRGVSFDSTAKGIRIAGTLSTPNDDKKHPAVLMITGNGPHTRDQMISNSPMFKMLGEHFARHGFVVLRTDARGYGDSTGPNDWEQYTTADRIEDNRAALAFLRKQKGVDISRVILFGHSEGAMIAAALAASGAEPFLSVLLAPSTLKGDEVVSRQLAGNLLRRGADVKTAEAVRQEFLKFAEFAVKDGKDGEKFQEIALAFLKAHGVADDKLDPEFAKGLLKGYLSSPWYRYFLSYDPAEDLSKIKTPVFAIFGGEDTNVPWRIQLPPFIEGMKAAGNQDFSAIVIPDQDHFFLEFEGKRLEKHNPGKMLIADELFAALDGELTRRGLAGAACTSPN